MITHEHAWYLMVSMHTHGPSWDLAAVFSKHELRPCCSPYARPLGQMPAPSMVTQSWRQMDGHDAA